VVNRRVIIIINIKTLMNYDNKTIRLKEISDEVGTREKCLWSFSFLGKKR
jgi:hypothetical protein